MGPGRPGPRSPHGALWIPHGASWHPCGAIWVPRGTLWRPNGFPVALHAQTCASLVRTQEIAGCLLPACPRLRHWNHFSKKWYHVPLCTISLKNAQNAQNAPISQNAPILTICNHFSKRKWYTPEMVAKCIHFRKMHPFGTIFLKNGTRRNG